MKRTISILMLFFSVLLTGVSQAEPVNINTADQDAIASNLIGIGESKAAAIIAYREANGLFKSVDELLEVKGVGESILNKNRDNIFISTDK